MQKELNRKKKADEKTFSSRHSKRTYAKINIGINKIYFVHIEPKMW